MTLDHDENSVSSDLGRTPAVSVSKRDWILWAARSLFVLAFIPLAVMAYYSFRLQPDEIEVMDGAELELQV